MRHGHERPPVGVFRSTGAPLSAGWQARYDRAGLVVDAAKPQAQPQTASAVQEHLADRWRVVLLDDPVNIMSYVVMVLKKVMGFDETRARKHMLEAHEQGRSVVWTGVREPAEAYVFSLQQWHLTAVLEPDETS